MLGIDQHRHNADLPRDTQASLQGVQEEIRSEPAALRGAIHGETRQARNGNRKAGETLCRPRRQIFPLNGADRNRVIAEDPPGFVNLLRDRSRGNARR